MAADVSSMVKGRNSEILITRDLLGGLSKVRNTSPLDLDLQIPKSCLEMPLHLQTAAMVYQQRCNSPNSPLSSSFAKRNDNKDTEKTIQDNKECPPLKFLEESCLELKLLPSSHCQSVCTLDKVKSALQRAEKETISKKRSSLPSHIEQEEQQQEKGGKSSGGGGGGGDGDNGMFAAGCPGCFMYVMTLKTNPKCPRCNSTVPSPFLLKRPRIDLNA
ncbi:hypothetical protein P3X46_019956 [Hevea brasiliensis]|uniref:GIR1-like zinc ribbon domain-containing protein n=1 Tax=Hevea brasiliensis TaxID=3981 RepID=A0ABQ9LKD1_HEVBR|nr:uncharacterized protein LOC110656882 [Hevea brasiliensis]KAJ9168431.1 hypothetical protein P3X46_019956 [Hevea brasiliensis]